MNDQDSREFKRAANVTRKNVFFVFKIQRGFIMSAIVFARDVKNNNDRVTWDVQNNNKLCKVILRKQNH